jgi:phosphatidylinositol alpha-1,6-mannosyltransferase
LVHVLEGRNPAGEAPRSKGADEPRITHHSGSRVRFGLAVAAARCDLRLFDHAGLARLQGLIAPLGGPYLLLIHGVEMWRVGRSDYHRAARNAVALIANSNYTANRTREAFPDLPPIHVCWPGRDAPSKPAPGGGGPVDGIGSCAMLIVGRLDPEQRHKGHDQLLDALPLVLETAPEAQLVVAGEGGDRARLERRARDLGVERQVRFTGRLDEDALQALYSQCALFVMPSDGDGFGLVFLEAMMHGLPCVGLAGGAAAEIFEDGVSGVLVDRDDTPGLAACLSGLLADEVRRRALGRAGLERYRGRFTASRYAERLEALLAGQIQRLERR